MDRFGADCAWIQKNARGLNRKGEGMTENYSIALKEFTQITKTKQIIIPDDIGDVQSKLNTLGNLLTSSDWARAAIVRAWVYKGKGGPRTGRVLSQFSMREFAELGIQGLSTKDSVSYYWHAWEDKSEKPTPIKGELIDLPEKPFPEWESLIDMGGLKSSQSNEWYTPARYIEAAREVMGSIDLDPASSELANKTVKAKNFITEEDNPNGLEQDWFGNVWLNPPYGKGSGLFTTKLVQEYPRHVDSAILLLNAYGFDSGWFQPLWDHIICFTDHRIVFWSPGRGSGGPANANIFIYLGDNPEKFRNIFRQFGNIVRNWNE